MRAPLSAFAFSDESFRFEKYEADKQEVLFSDASGQYRLSLKEMLAPDGNLNRKAQERLTAVQLLKP